MEILVFGAQEGPGLKFLDKSLHKAFIIQSQYIHGIKMTLGSQNAAIIPL